MSYKYKISVVMAVYNAEKYLNEAVDSLIRQDVGFGNIQLIMVDDGSPDGSGRICDEYAALYPNNIVVVHKENGGVASARNEGLKYAEGEYLNFMDSDDRMEVTAFSKMYNFFTEHKEETDMVTIPIRFFDAARGDHWQNTKFKKGTRVINLVDEPKNSLMFVNATLFNAQLKDKICFDSALPCGEDIKVIYTLLEDKKTIGVVGKTCYFYRRNNAGQNLVATSQTKRSWYFEYFTHLNDWLADFYTEKEGCIPEFVQYLFASEIQWRFKPDSNTIVERNILTEDEFIEYKKNVRKTLGYIKDEYLLQIPSLYFEQKIHILKMKRGKEADVIWDYGTKKGLISVNNTFVGHLSKPQLTVELTHIEGNSVIVEGYFTIPNIVKDYSLMASFNGKSIEAEWLSEGREVMFFKEPFLTRRPYRFVFDMTDVKDVDRGGKGVFVNFFFKVDDDKVVRLENVKYGKRSPFTRKYKNNFYHKDGITVLDGHNRIYMARESARKIKERNKLFRKELLSNKKDTVSVKAAAVRMGLPALVKQKKKPVWLISDRYEKAGDNGEAFFKYIVENHKEIDAYFILFKSSDDYERLSKIGNVIEPYSWTHKMKHLVADAVISAHADDFIYSPFRGSERPYKDLLANKKFIFLQHGIIKDDISRLFNRLDNNMSMFVTSVVPEYKSLLEYPYLYTEKQVKLTGLPRYDLLENKAEKVITILPTWRSYVVTGTDSHTGKRNVKPGYEKTMYYKMYSDLLSNEDFISEITKRGYRLQWVIHPNMTAFQDVFNIDERIEVMPENVSYREVFEKTSLLITDYSSVAFDVAYMRKPVVYYQADHEEFFSGLHTYDKGYFEYERDGLGEVEYTLDSLMKTILQYIEKDCELNPVYRKRIDNFFAFDDKNNCQRVYEEIINLENNDE